MFKLLKMFISVLHQKEANEKWKREKEKVDKLYKQTLKELKQHRRKIKKQQAEFERRWKRIRGELDKGASKTRGFRL